MHNEILIDITGKSIANEYLQYFATDETRFLSANSPSLLNSPNQEEELINNLATPFIIVITDKPQKNFIQNSLFR